MKNELHDKIADITNIYCQTWLPYLDEMSAPFLVQEIILLILHIVIIELNLF